MTDNPQAFPCLDSSGYGLSMHDPGMTLRDWFAGQALASMGLPNDGKYSVEDRQRGYPEQEAKWFSVSAYRIADALLSERAKSSAT